MQSYEMAGGAKHLTLLPNWDHALPPRLHDGQVHLSRAHDDRWRLHPQSSTHGFIRLRDDERNLVLARQRVERRYRELRSAAEDELHLGGCY